MKKIYNILFGLFSLFVLYSCGEKELILPESTSNENPLDNMRPPLRPDAVSVYADFYHTLEIVFPEQQPDRVVKAEIEWDKELGTWEKIAVSDFDEIIRLENLELREYTFKIVYLTADNLASKAVTLKQTPLQELYKYVENTIKVVGDEGMVTIDWKNVTERELRVDLRYQVDGQERTLSKLSSKELDTLLIDDLDRADYIFNVSVFDPAKALGSAETQIVANPGDPLAGTVLETVDLLSLDSNPLDYMVVSFGNPSVQMPVTVKIDYTQGDGSPRTVEYVDVLNNPNFKTIIADVQLGSTATVSVEDARFIRTKTITISSTGATVVEYEQAIRNTWEASASSFRGQTGNPVSLSQSGTALLDGVFGGPTTEAGWQNEWGININPDGAGNSSQAFPHWVQVDMKETKIVTGFRTINHANSVQNGAGVFILKYSLDGVNFIDAQTYTRPMNPQSVRNQSLSYTLDVPIIARYIRYHGVSSDSNSTGMRMAEFYVSGVE